MLVDQINRDTVIVSVALNEKSILETHFDFTEIKLKRVDRQCL